MHTTFGRGRTIDRRDYGQHRKVSTNEDTPRHLFKRAESHHALERCLATQEHDEIVIFISMERDRREQRRSVRRPSPKDEELRTAT
jgi:hypothetical protein